MMSEDGYQSHKAKADGIRSSWILCPHCQSRSAVRTSRQITRTYRQMTIACGNAACGHTFGAELSVTHTISPSAVPHAGLELRMSPPRRRPGTALPQPANDQIASGPAVPLATPGAMTATG